MARTPTTAGALSLGTLVVLGLLAGTGGALAPADRIGEAAPAPTAIAGALLLDRTEPLEPEAVTFERGEPARPTTTAPTTTAAPTSTAAPTTAAPSTTTVPPTTAPSTTASPSTTEAATPIGVEERGRAALASLGYQPSAIGWTIAFLPGREGVLGYTHVDQRHIEVFVRDGMSESLLRHVIAHEVGHAVDVTLNSTADRERWMAARGLGSAPWWPGNGATDFSTGAGDFAECFAAWQVGAGNFRSRLGGAPDAGQLALIAELAGG